MRLITNTKYARAQNLACKKKDTLTGGKGIGLVWRKEFINWKLKKDKVTEKVFYTMCSYTVTSHFRNIL